MLKRLSERWDRLSTETKVLIVGGIIVPIIVAIIQPIWTAILERVTPPPTVIVQAPVSTPAAATLTLAQTPQTATPTSTLSTPFTQVPTNVPELQLPTATAPPYFPRTTSTSTSTPSAALTLTAAPTLTPSVTLTPSPPRTFMASSELKTTPTSLLGRRTPTSSPTATPTSVREDVRFALPVVNNETCETLIQATNVGWATTKAAIILFGEPGACAPQCNGPVRATCMGPIIPGATLTFRVDRPPSARSGLVYSIGEPPEDSPLCTTEWKYDLEGDCIEWRRYDRLYVSENLMPSDRNNNGRRDVEDEFDIVLQPLAVNLIRRCLVGGTTVVEATYTAISESVGGAGVGVFSEYIYKAPLGFDPISDAVVTLYIQNVGNECASVEIWFQRRDDGSRVGDELTILALEAGERQQVDSSTMPEPVSQLDAWIRSIMPLAIVVDIVGGDTFESDSVLSQTQPEESERGP